jgi:hypothetical protein
VVQSRDSDSDWGGSMGRISKQAAGSRGGVRAMLKKNSHSKLNHGCCYFAFRFFSNPYAIRSCDVAFWSKELFPTVGHAVRNPS